MLRQEAINTRYGNPPRDLSQYSEWRDEVYGVVERSLEFYSLYLSGQMSGFSEALDLSSVKVALEIEDIPREDWPAETQRVLLIHSELMQHLQKAKRV